MATSVGLASQALASIGLAAPGLAPQGKTASQAAEEKVEEDRWGFHVVSLFRLSGGDGSVSPCISPHAAGQHLEHTRLDQGP